MYYQNCNSRNSRFEVGVKNRTATPIIQMYRIIKSRALRIRRVGLNAIHVDAGKKYVRWRQKYASKITYV